jgi:hypothetical protein
MFAPSAAVPETTLDGLGIRIRAQNGNQAGTA